MNGSDVDAIKNGLRRVGGGGPAAVYLPDGSNPKPGRGSFWFPSFDVPVVPILIF